MFGACEPGLADLPQLPIWPGMLRRYRPCRHDPSSHRPGLSHTPGSRCILPAFSPQTITPRRDKPALYCFCSDNDKIVTFTSFKEIYLYFIIKTNAALYQDQSGNIPLVKKII